MTFRNSCGIAWFEGEEAVRGVELCTACRSTTSRGGSARSTGKVTIGSLACDVVVVAAGMRPDSGAFGLPINASGTIQVDSGTLQTSVPHVFAAGDVVLGPSMITSAAGQGRRAAFMIDRWLQGQELDPGEFDGALPVDGQGRGLGADRRPTARSSP